MPKNLFYILFVLLIASVAAFAQAKTDGQIQNQITKLNAEKSITVEYDDEGGTSKVFAAVKDFGNKFDKTAGVESFSFGMAFVFAGKTLTAAPAEINLTFRVLTKKPRFAEAHHLTVITAGETFDLGEARYIAKPREAMEYLNFKIPRQTFAKIADAGSAKLKIGSAEFTFTPEHLKIFDDLLKISDPAVH